MRDEARLVRKALDGDRAAFDDLLAPHTQRAYRTACLITHDLELADDAVQDGLLRAYRSLGNFRPESAFYPWFSRIVIHEALKQCKRMSRFRLLTLDRPPGDWPEFLTAPPNDTPELALAIREERKRLWHAISRLSPMHRTVIVLRYFEELSEPEVAAVLGIPVGTVKSRSFHARAALERILQKPAAPGSLCPVAEGGTLDD